LRLLVVSPLPPFSYSNFLSSIISFFYIPQKSSHTAVVRTLSFRYRLTLLRCIVYVWMDAIPHVCFISIVFLSWFVINLLACIRFLFPHPLHHFYFCCTRIISNQNQHSPYTRNLTTSARAVALECVALIEALFDGATAQVARPSAGKFPRLVVIFSVKGAGVAVVSPSGPRPPCPESLIMADPPGTGRVNCTFHLHRSLALCVPRPFNCSSPLPPGHAKLPPSLFSK
jgi:hypothetical protein